MMTCRTFFENTSFKLQLWIEVLKTLFYSLLLCMWMYRGDVCAIVCMWRSEDSCVESVLFYFYVGFEDTTQTTRLAQQSAFTTELSHWLLNWNLKIDYYFLKFFQHLKDSCRMLWGHLSSVGAFLLTPVSCLPYSTDTRCCTVGNLLPLLSSGDIISYPLPLVTPSFKNYTDRNLCMKEYVKTLTF